MSFIFWGKSESEANFRQCWLIDDCLVFSLVWEVPFGSGFLVLSHHYCHGLVKAFAAFWCCGCLVVFVCLV